MKKSANRIKLLALLVLWVVLSFNTIATAATYYLTSSSDPTNVNNWWTSPAGSGSHPPSFADNNGDVFNIRPGITATLGSNWTIGSGSASGTGVIVNDSGIVVVGNNTLTITGKGATRNSTFNVKSGGTITFDVSGVLNLFTDDAACIFSLSTGATLKTKNATGVMAIAGSCSINKTNNATCTLGTGGVGANFEFNGGAQGMTGMPATVNNLTFSGTGAITYSAVTTISNNFTMSGSSTITSITSSFSIGGVFTIGASNSFTAVASSTVTMNNGSSLLNSGTFGFYNLTIAAGTTTVTTSSSFTIGGTLTVGSGANFSPTGGTITMSGATGAIVNSGGTLAFSGLTISGTISGSGDFSVAATMTVNGTFTPDAAEIISGAGTLTGTGTVKATRTSATPDFSSQYTITNKTLSALTVDYSGAGAQTVNALDYYNLTISTNGTRTVTLANTGTIGISGTFSPTPTTTTYTITSSTVNYNGTSNQTIIAFTYNNLSSSNNNRTLASSGTIDIAGTFTPGSGTYTITNSTINFSGSNGQTIPAFTYNNLSSSNNNRTLQSSGTIDIAGTYTPGTGTYTVTGSTVNFSGSNGQTISAATYNNLSSSNNNRVLASSGTIFIAGTFTPGSGTYTITNSTINFNGSNGQTIPAFTYYNLSSSDNNRTLASSGTIYIAGVFTPGSGTYTVAGSTVNFNGTTQSIPVPNGGYQNLTISNSGTKTIAADVPVHGNLTISAGTLADNGYKLTVNGDVSNSDTHTTTSSGKILLSGGSLQHHISGGTFGNVELDDTQGAALTSGMIINNNLTLTRGTLNLNGNIITLCSNCNLANETNTNYIYGTSGYIQTTRTLTVGVANNPGNLGAIINPMADLGSVNIKRGHAEQTGLGNHSVLRYYDINPTNSSLEVSLTISYFDAENNGVTSNQKLYFSFNSGSTWREISPSSVSNVSNTTSVNINPSWPYTGTRWTVGSGGAPLPIELLLFNGVYENKKVSFYWSTAAEINNDYFTIERSANGKNFEIITTVKSAGNSNKILKYSAIDESPPLGIVYYRLKQTDFDGTYKYSDVISVNVNENNSISGIEVSQPYFNGSNIKAVISNLSGTDVYVEIYNVLGAVYYSKIFKPSQGNIDINIKTDNLSGRGVYFLRVGNGKESVVKKFVF